MLKQLFIIGICIFTFSLSQAQRNFWSSVEYEDVNVNQDDIINYDMTVKQASYFQMDKSSISSLLHTAPNRNNTSSSNVILQIPNHKGDFEAYEMFKVQTLSPQLAQDYPKIKSYVGKRSDSPDGSILRITITPQGFYAMILKPDVGQLFINPYDKNGQYYMSFLKSQATDLNHPNCEFDGTNGLVGEVSTQAETQTFIVDDSTLRTYDLALACTGEYSQFHINQAGLGSAPQAQQIAAVLAAMTVTIR